MEQRKDYIFRRDKLCNLPMDNLTLFTDFKNNGYRTLFADDWVECRKTCKKYIK
jgi:hypothetical protein